MTSLNLREEHFHAQLTKAKQTNRKQNYFPCFRHIPSTTLIYSHTYHQKSTNSEVVFLFNEYNLFFPSLFSVIKSAYFRIRRLIDTPGIVKLKCSAIPVGVMMSFSLRSNNMRLLLSSESAFQGEPTDFVYTLVYL